MKKILIVGALATEINIIKKEIKKLKFSNIKFNFFHVGMGNYNMILKLTRFLEKNNDFDFVLNIGICGYKEQYQDFIQIGRIKNLSNGKELIVPNIINFGKIESISCSEVIIYDKKDILEEKFVDMESYGFEKVCDSFNLPRLILKVPVDKIGEETKNFDFEKAKLFLEKNIDFHKLILDINDYLNKISPKLTILDIKNNNLKERIFNYYKWTFSEKIILEKEINKIYILEIGNLEDFFDNNKKLGKKEFLNKLKILG